MSDVASWIEGKLDAHAPGPDVDPASVAPVLHACGALAGLGQAVTAAPG